MKKIVSIAVLATLCSAPLMHGMNEQSQTYTKQNSANSGSLTGSSSSSSSNPGGSLTGSSSSSSSNPDRTQAPSSWKKHLQTGAWGATSAAFGAGSLGFGILSLKLLSLRAPGDYGFIVDMATKGWGLTAVAASIGCGFSSLFFAKKALKNHRSN